MKIKFGFSDDLILSAQGGLVLVGDLLSLTNLEKRLNMTTLDGYDHLSFPAVMR